MHRVLRYAMSGSAVLSIGVLVSCGPGSAVKTRIADTPTVWQLPPVFTQTLTATITFTASPDVSPTPTPPEAQTAVSTPIAAGWNHTCAVTSEGGVMCWGSNADGQLGDGSKTTRTKPVSVKNLTVRIVAVTAGWGHTCALSDQGGVKCWGRNKNGELGDGTTQRSSEPVDVSGLGSGIVAIAAGDDHTCAITSQGGVKCWGENSFGQLGDGTTEAQNIPVDVPVLSGGTVAVAAGKAHTCAWTIRGEVMCWGNNEAGQLGDGSETTSRGTPKVVPGLTEGIAALASKGNHTCIVTGSGGMQCWGENKYGQLGDGTTQKQPAPVAVTGLGGSVVMIAAGWNQTCGVLTDGVLKCWGWNFYGQLGEGSMSNKRQPVAVQRLTGKTLAVSGGGGHTCALLDNGEIFCWGLNESGQLGDQTNLNSGFPVKVKGISIKAGK
jgi:alpha-tubulin suppressor-like RCC1 family protein